jgi:hypothetical protein
MAAEYSNSALDYQVSVPAYSDLEEGYFFSNIPLNSIDDAETITVKFPVIDEFIDLPECFMDVELEIRNSDGTPLAENADVAFVDNTPFSIFKSLVVYVNGIPVTPSTVYQTYTNYFATRFGTPQSAAQIHLKAIQGFTSETAGMNDTRTAAAVGWSARKAEAKGSKKVHFRTPIPSDFFRTSAAYLPPRQKLELEFKLNSSAFALNASATTYKFKLEKISVHCRKVSVASFAAMAVNKNQAHKGLKMNFTSLETQSHTIAAAKQVEHISGLFPRHSPNQIFLMLIETDRINGVMTKDPFKFENAMVEKVVLRQNGRPLMIECQKSNFTEGATQDAVEPYWFLIQSLNVGHNGTNANITLDQFINGSTVWSWILSPDMDANNGMRLPPRPGNFEVDIYVKSGHTTNAGLTALFIGKGIRTVEINELNAVSIY